MFFSLLKNKIIGNEFLAIEIFSITNDDLLFSITHIRKVKNELQIISSKIVSEIDTKSIKKLQIPIFININTNKVLHKTLENLEKNETLVFKKAFPGLKTEEFYFSIWNTENENIIFIARKEYVQKIESLFKEISSFFLNINIGISPLKNIIEYFTPDSSIVLNAKSLDLSNYNITNTSETVSKNFSVNGIQISSEDILNFSSVINFLTQNKYIGNISELNNKTEDSFFQNVFFKKTSKALIYFSLAALTINYFFFSHYFDQYNRLASLNQNSEFEQQKIISLEQEVVKKEQILKAHNLPSNLKPSYIINNIVKEIPSTVILSELIFNPILKKGKDGTISEFNKNELILSGKTSNSEKLLTWTKELEQKKAIKKISFIKYEKTDLNNTFFSLKIVLNEAP
jgi:hypothetical protein